jgi:hypothetical protein
LEQALHLLQRSGGGQVLNTSYIERLNGTVRERLATLTRKCRHAASRLPTLETGMYLIGCTYNFCCFHQQLSTRAAGEAQRLLRLTPAMASGLTDHLWSLSDLLGYKVAPAPWVKPKRRKHPRSQPVAGPSLPKRPRGRPRTRPLPDPNVPKRPRGRPRKIPLSTVTVSWGYTLRIYALLLLGFRRTGTMGTFSHASLLICSTKPMGEE